MIYEFFKYLGLFLMLIVIQFLIIQNINFGGTFSILFQPQIVILLVLLLPVNISHIAMIIFSFIIGLAVDTQFNTYGINAFIFTLIGFVRYYVTAHINNQIGVREEDNRIWTSRKGKMWKYAYFASFILLYHFLFILIDGLGKNFFTIGISTILVSSISSFTLALILENLLFSPSKRNV